MNFPVYRRIVRICLAYACYFHLSQTQTAQSCSMKSHINFVVPRLTSFSADMAHVKMGNYDNTISLLLYSDP